MGFMLCSGIVAGIAVAMGVYLSIMTAPRYLPWHEGSKWERLFRIYDQIAADSALQNCQTFNVSTNYGSTFGYDCRPQEHISAPALPVVLMFHGAGSNSLIFGNWLIEPIVERAGYRAITVDYPCDTGKSRPPQGDPAKCPQTQPELAQWVEQVTQQLQIESSFSVLGYSFGSFVAAVAAQELDDVVVDKVICLAPAAVFTPIEGAWLWRAILFGLTRTRGMQDWFFRYMSADPTYSIRTHHGPAGLELLDATHALGATVLAVNPTEWPMSNLTALSKGGGLLVVGEEETVINATRAVERAEEAGWTVKLHANAGHLLLIEPPANATAVEEIVEFLRQGREVQQEDSTGQEEEHPAEQEVTTTNEEEALAVEEEQPTAGEGKQATEEEEEEELGENSGTGPMHQEATPPQEHVDEL